MILPDIEEFYIELGARIKTERTKRKINQEDLGAQLELTRASIINLEKGRHRPSIYQLLSIANYFNLEYTALIPIYTNSQKRKKLSASELTNMISDQEEVDKSTKTTVLDFLSAIKKQ
jgi:transcriptional regulator with XRE-family HTH domain